MMPIGSGVRYRQWLGRVVRKSAEQRRAWPRSHVAVLIDGVVHQIPYRSLTYVARRYADAVAWEAR